MNTPIIDPRVFYWIAVADNLQTLGEVVFIIAAGFTVFYTAKLMAEAEFTLSRIKTPVITLVMFGVLLSIMPSRTTLLSMLVARQVTPDNVEQGKTLVLEIVTEIINATKEKSK